MRVVGKDPATGAEIIKETDDLTAPKYAFSVFDGLLEGTYTEWWNNGKLRYQIEYHNGHRDGSFKTWNIKGILTKNRIYENGELVETIL